MLIRELSCFYRATATPNPNLATVVWIVKVCQSVDKNNDVRYDVYFHPDEERLLQAGQKHFQQAYQHHGQIKVFHRICKQSKIEKIFVRIDTTIRTHIFGTPRVFIRLTAMINDKLADSFDALHRQLFLLAL